MKTNVRITATLDLEKETKGTVRYAERVADGEKPKIGTLYIRKTAFGVPDYPQAIRVAVEPTGPAE